MRTKEKIKKALINLPGKRIKDKIVVFESDDWGMVRTSSKKAFDNLLEKGYSVNSCPYNTYDALESVHDVNALLNVLTKVKDIRGHSASFTINNVVGNPDFDKIRASGFTKYFYEPFTVTAKKYKNTEGLVELYKEGLSAGAFKPQFHGREHVNVNRWLHELKNGNKGLLDAFDNYMFTLPLSGGTSGRRDYLDAFGMAYAHEYESMNSIISSGLKLFQNIWGYESKSFIAPCYVWPSEIESYLKENGVQYIQGTHVQVMPQKGLELKIDKKYHYQGQNKNGLMYLVRNVHFEPTESKLGEAAIAKAMKEIDFVFSMKKPAIVSSHRVNYIGRLHESNRTENLKYLRVLLEKIVEKHPDVLFMSSDELGDYMMKN